MAAAGTTAAEAAAVAAAPPPPHTTARNIVVEKTKSSTVAHARTSATHTRTHDAFLPASERARTRCVEYPALSSWSAMVVMLMGTPPPGSLGSWFTWLTWIERRPDMKHVRLGEQKLCV